LLHILVSLLCDILDEECSTLCLVKTASTSSSFVREHFLIKDNDNGNFPYNLADANYTEGKQ